MLQSLSCPYQFIRVHQKLPTHSILTSLRISSGSSTAVASPSKPQARVTMKPQVARRPIAGTKAGTATQGRGIVGPLLNASTSPNPSSSSHRIPLPLTSCWRIGLRFSVMEIVQVMCFFFIWVCFLNVFVFNFRIVIY